MIFELEAEESWGQRGRREDGVTDEGVGQKESIEALRVRLDKQPPSDRHD